MTDNLREILQGALGASHRIERELGGGGMSRVFVARDLSLDRDVVVKVLPDESTHGVNADRFRREIQVIARLQHPHIIPILAAGAAEGTLYYLMPFMGGETLRARLSREGPLAVADTVRILREVLDALSFAHKHGVIHRDIKPENVLLEAEHAVVADFGIAKALRDSGNMTSAGISLGTPAYAAPEQAMADPATDHRADLYAVGAMAYEMLSGTPVFSGSVQQVMAAHLTTPPTPIRDRRSDIPAPLADLIMRALAKEPGERPQSAGEMLAALDAAVTPVATTPMPSTASSRAPRTKWYAGMAGIALLAVAAFLASHSRAPRLAVTKGAEVIAVLPLAAVSDSSLARLGQDLVVTLTSNFDGVGLLRTTDAVTVLTNARKLKQPIPLADALVLGRRLGAHSVLTGTLIADGTQVRASVALYRVDGDSVIAKATAVASPTAIAALTDSLTWQVLRQIWQRGTAPSPMLAGLTTSSFDALRAFLDGEQRFQELDVPGALALYRRAFEFDSNFAQAYMRHNFVQTWHGEPGDSLVRSRLFALISRLPERERAWVETRRLGLSVPRQFEAWKALAARYPDYPPVLMSTADIIIHSGGYYGIEMSAVRQYIDRLVELAPENGDARLHQLFVAAADERWDDARAAYAETMRVTKRSPYAQVFPLWSGMAPFGVRDPTQRMVIADSGLQAFMRDPMYSVNWTGFVGAFFSDIPWDEREAVFAHWRGTGLLRGELDVASRSGEGLARISRGNWLGGLRDMQRAEPAYMPVSLRTAAARLSAIGAWLGAVDPSVADTTLERVRRLSNVERTLADRVELQWLDGLIGVSTGNDARVRHTLATLRTDTSALARHAGRALAGLWMERTNPGAGTDSLRSLTDSIMAGSGGTFLTTAEAVDRFVIARSLRRRGQPALADRYLTWAQFGSTNPRVVSLAIALWPLVAYERGIARDDAGDAAGAARYLQRFVDVYDHPPDAHRPLVEDARKRLKRLTGDAPK